MGTIADKLNNILECKADIKSAIEEKGQLVGDAPLVEYAEKIRAIETGGDPEPEEAPWNDVRFVDFDGTCILSYSAEDFLALEEMPTNPKVHEYLTNDGWNWSFENALSYVRKYRYCLIGAIYKSFDDATRICVDLTEDLLEVPLSFRLSKSYGVLVDWGDGTEPERFRSANVNVTYDFPHTYEAPGEYIITITPDEDCTLLLELSGYEGCFGYYYANYRWMYYDAIKWMIIGRVNYDLTYIQSLGNSQEFRVIPNGGIKYFSNSHLGLRNKALILPQSFNSLVTNVHAYQISCKEISLPDAITTISVPINFHAECREIIIPEGVSTLVLSAFATNYRARVIIIPDSVASMGNYPFLNCYCAEYIHLSNNAQLTQIPQGAFSECRSLKQIEIPSQTLTIGNSAFSNCLSIEQITLNEGLLTIGNSAFFGCSKIKELTIPSTVTSIGTLAFNFLPAHMFGTERVYMKPTTPPTLAANVTTIFRFASDYTIYVPTGSLSAYQSATNWSAAASKMVEYDYE